MTFLRRLATSLHDPDKAFRNACLKSYPQLGTEDNAAIFVNNCNICLDWNGRYPHSHRDRPLYLSDGNIQSPIKLQIGGRVWPNTNRLFYSANGLVSFIQGFKIKLDNIEVVENSGSRHLTGSYSVDGDSAGGREYNSEITVFNKRNRQIIFYSKYNTYDGYTKSVWPKDGIEELVSAARWLIENRMNKPNNPKPSL